MRTKVAVIFHSTGGTLYQIARAVGSGAEAAGAEVRLRRLRDAGTSPADPPEVSEAHLGDLEWADAFVFGTPARFGNVSAELKLFIDSTVPLWRQGRLTDKVVAGFTSASSIHGGQETTLLALYQSMYHWGSIIVPAGCTERVMRDVGGNPYGLSVTVPGDGTISEADRAAACFFGGRVARTAERLSLQPAVGV